jgi:hypothetical protein
MKKGVIDINEGIIKKYVESLRPEDLEVRKQLDFGYSYDGSTVEVYEIRPIWNNPEELQHIPFTKFRYYKSRETWNLYWMRASGKYELYEPFPESSNLYNIIDVLTEDKHGCFHG